MKKNQRTVKIYDSTHTKLANASNRFGVSMAALVELLVAKLETMKTLELPSRPVNGRKMNARRALAA